MPAGHGYRSRTRDLFQRGYRQNGVIPLSTYLRTYKVGDYVDVKANAAVQKGMPHKFYHGKTGVVWNVTKRAVGVEINKTVGNRILRKRIHVRVEHVKPSRCREGFLIRRAENDKKKQEAKAAGKTVDMKSLRRKPAEPKGAFSVSNVSLQTVTPVPYDILKEGLAA
ncbi:unnamed protein product [Pedinophyceae sp. YPF-701]|nr:unnamed protein product [Pedinophyceae sp. YPF-701]